MLSVLKPQNRALCQENGDQQVQQRASIDHQQNEYYACKQTHAIAANFRPNKLFNHRKGVKAELQPDIKRKKRSDGVDNFFFRRL